jgi:DNA-binding NarL/FixJ family response regulator
MENIMIINEKEPFREGLKMLIELKFGSLFSIIEKDSKKPIAPTADDKVPKLIIVEKIRNENTRSYLKTMKQKGSKVVLLMSNVDTLHESVELDVFSGFLTKNMNTNHMIRVIEDILEHDEVYVHPTIGRFFLGKFLKNNK